MGGGGLAETAVYKFSCEQNGFGNSTIFYWHLYRFQTFHPWFLNGISQIFLYFLSVVITGRVKNYSRYFTKTGPISVGCVNIWYFPLKVREGKMLNFWNKPPKKKWFKKVAKYGAGFPGGRFYGRPPENRTDRFGKKTLQLQNRCVMGRFLIGAQFTKSSMDLQCLVSDGRRER